MLLFLIANDWENDPQEASKVVDENGEPLVVWHTSPNYFNIFDAKKSIKGIFHFANHGETSWFDLLIALTSIFASLTNTCDNVSFSIN